MDTCIFCKQSSESDSDFQLTDEHIFPKCIGGWITIPYVCKKCNNDLFGSQVESMLKRNAVIVKAIADLGIQNKEKAFGSATPVFRFHKGISTKGKIIKDGDAVFHATKQDDGSLIVPENDSKDVLQKQIKRNEKKHNVNVSFNIDDFDSYPCDVEIPIPDTDISFIKRKAQKNIIVLTGLSAPIPFLVPAKIAFEFLSYISYDFYDFVMNEIFDPFREWIANNDNPLC